MQRLTFGDIVLVDVFCADGSGWKERPCIVIEDDDELRVVCGSSQHALPGGLLPGEFLVNNKNDMKVMGLDTATRFSWRGWSDHYPSRSSVIEKIGTTPKTIFGEAFKAARIIGVY